MAASFLGGADRGSRGAQRAFDQHRGNTGSLCPPRLLTRICVTFDNFHWRALLEPFFSIL